MNITQTTKISFSYTSRHILWLSSKHFRNKQVSDWHALNPKSSNVLVMILCHTSAACRTYYCGIWRPGFPCSESRNLMVAACEWLPPTSLTNKYAMLISRCSTATSGAHLWPVMHGKSTALQRAPKLPHSSIYSVGRTLESRLYPPTADHVATISMRSRSSQAGPWHGLYQCIGIMVDRMSWALINSAHCQMRKHQQFFV